jgi:protein dithiol:quinone oxidoreductase
MCMMQRSVFSLIAIICFIACIHNAAYIGQKVYATIIAIVSSLGAAIATRQLWLQSLPEDQVPACGPGIDYMLEVFPLLEVIEMAIRGTGDCAKVQWTFLNISIPGWSLFAFVTFALLAISILFIKRNK